MVRKQIETGEFRHIAWNSSVSQQLKKILNNHPKKVNYITEFKVCVLFCYTWFIWFVWIVRIGFETWQNSIRQNEQWIFYVFVRRIQFAAISMPHLAVALFSVQCNFIFFFFSFHVSETYLILYFYSWRIRHLRAQLG